MDCSKIRLEGIAFIFLHFSSFISFVLPPLLRAIFWYQSYINRFDDLKGKSFGGSKLYILSIEFKTPTTVCRHLLNKNKHYQILQLYFLKISIQYGHIMPLWTSINETISVIPNFYIQHILFSRYHLFNKVIIFTKIWCFNPFSMARW